MTQQASQTELNYFENQARLWALEVVELYKTPVVGIENVEKQRLLNRAKKIKDSIEFITGDLNALKPIDEMQLDAIPVFIGAGAVATAAAFIYKWNTDYKTFKKTLAERVRLERAGLTPTQAANLTNTLTPTKKSLINLDYKKIIIPAAVIIGGFYLVKNVRKTHGNA